MSKNGMANYGRFGRTVNLTHMPTPKAEYTVNFSGLYGGLNLYDPDYQLSELESPEMVNMLWRDGALRSRNGQEWLSEQALGTGYACTATDFHGHYFFHIGENIYHAPWEDTMSLAPLCDLSGFSHGYEIARGTFFPYGEDLYYKARGIYIRIRHQNGAFTVSDMLDEAYTPVTYINADPLSGAGQAYQPENRLSNKKTVWYSVEGEMQSEQVSISGSATSYLLAGNPSRVLEVTVNGATYANWSYANGSLTLLGQAPASGSVIKAFYKVPVRTYQLPVKNLDSIVEVKVNGVSTTAYTANLANGTITFNTAPAIPEPFESNTVRITYSKANPQAVESIMSCCYATSYGGDQNICLVFGGCAAQPNAYFWNGNTNVAMDAGYFPMEQYNLGGSTSEEVTGFGKQHGYLIVFKSNSIGRCALNFTSTNLNDENTRVALSLDYTPINAKTGCNLPWTIQMVENNMVFCNREQGVQMLADTSAALENNVTLLSRKVNGSAERSGLLKLVRGGDEVYSFDDDLRYWLVCKGEVYCWDYTVSKPDKPSWFYLSGIDAVSFFGNGRGSFGHLDTQGRITRFADTNADYGGGYLRKYRFPTLFFGTYDRLKTVTGALFSLRTDLDTKARIQYKSDWETRYDLTDIVVESHRLVPRDLSRRNLQLVAFAFAARRRPACKHVRHFSMSVSNMEAGYDLALLNAQILYKYEGRDRGALK